MLEEFGANGQKTNNAGQTALDLSEQLGFLQLKELLRRENPAGSQKDNSFLIRYYYLMYEDLVLLTMVQLNVLLGLVVTH